MKKQQSKSKQKSAVTKTTDKKPKTKLGGSKAIEVYVNGKLKFTCPSIKATVIKLNNKFTFDQIARNAKGIGHKDLGDYSFKIAKEKQIKNGGQNG